jgi:hypothetical protein
MQCTVPRPQDGWYPITAQWLPLVSENPGWEFFVDPALAVDWLKSIDPNGGIFYSGQRAKGAKDMARRAVVGVGVGKNQKRYFRHRLSAIAGLGMTREQYYDKNLCVCHNARREESADPDDRPENLRVDTKKGNRNDPGSKKRKHAGMMHPVTLRSATRGEEIDFESYMTAAEHAGVDSRDIGKAVEGVRKSPLGEGRWEISKHTAIDLDDAVLLVGTRKAYMSTSRQNEFFVKNSYGKFVRRTFKPHEDGYLFICCADGKLRPLHAVVFETAFPDAISEKLAAMPPGSARSDIQIDHIDDDPLNNAPSNLQALTHAEHSRKHALGVDLLDVQDGNKLRSFECAKDAACYIYETNGVIVNPSNIQSVCDGKWKRTGGCYFAWTDHEHVAYVREARMKRRLDRLVKL